MEKIELEVSGIIQSSNSGQNYAMILSEVGGNRKIPIVIGFAEAQSIAIELEKMKPQRPLTHDLFKQLAHSVNIKLNEVIIYRYDEGIFFSILNFEKDSVIHSIDSRTSDAVALALRFNSPIYTYENILEEVGIMFKDEEEDTTPDDAVEQSFDDFIADDPAPGSENLESYSLEELRKMLALAVENEEFERASMIHGIIQKKEKN